VHCVVRKCHKTSNRSVRKNVVFHRIEQFQFRYVHISRQNIAADWRALGGKRYLGVG
jgi:hypothetical protein